MSGFLNFEIEVLNDRGGNHIERINMKLHIIHIVLICVAFDHKISS
jgi:hypothetical protein